MTVSTLIIVGMIELFLITAMVCSTCKTVKRIKYATDFLKTAISSDEELTEYDLTTRVNEIMNKVK